jgi:5,6-dimethylbenzimidazole synthase
MNVYDAIYGRRDVRRFRSDPVPDDVLLRLLQAAHHAGSVGFMQPWNFIIIRSQAVRTQVQAVFARENGRAADRYHGDRAELYRSLKLQGILDAPLNLAVTCDRQRKGPAVLGRNTVRDTDLYSTCCAVQNLWLAARAEGIGVGWVSILDIDEVKSLLGIPRDILLVAYLCIGYPQEFRDRPMLEEVGWEQRTPLAELVFDDAWLCPSSLFPGAQAEGGS